MNWTEVTQDEFYKVIGSLDVHPVTTGPWPYTSLFKTRSGLVRGKTELYYPEGSGLTTTRYWLPK